MAGSNEEKMSVIIKIWGYSFRVLKTLSLINLKSYRWVYLNGRRGPLDKVAIFTTATRIKNKDIASNRIINTFFGKKREIIEVSGVLNIGDNNIE